MKKRNVATWFGLGMVLFWASLVWARSYQRESEQQLQEAIQQAVQREVQQAINKAIDDDLPDVYRETRRQAARESARLVTDFMTKSKTFKEKNAMLEYSLKQSEVVKDGLHCEFGVFMGESINFLASKTDKVFHGFDSFEGLPETWREGFEKGTFLVNGLPKVRDNVRLHKGWFDRSVPVWLQNNPGPVAFLHMDADLYSSTKCVLDLLAPRMVPGTVIQFDEYFNYPGWKQGEYKAFQEFVAAHGVQFEYLGYVNRNEQAAIRILAIGKKS